MDSKATFVNIHETTTLRCWIPNPGVPCSDSKKKTLRKTPLIVFLDNVTQLHPANLLKMDSKATFVNIHETTTLRRWIPNPGVPCSKPLGGSKVDSAFHPFKVDQMSTRT